MDKTEMESYTSEYCMSAGDNAASRKTIDASLTSEAMTNEHSYRKVANKVIQDIAKPKA